MLCGSIRISVFGVFNSVSVSLSLRVWCVLTRTSPAHIVCTRQMYFTRASRNLKHRSRISRTFASEFAHSMYKSSVCTQKSEAQLTDDFESGGGAHRSSDVGRLHAEHARLSARHFLDGQEVEPIVLHNDEKFRSTCACINGSFGD